MTVRVQQLCLLVLAASAAFVGGWALITPKGFYDSFPGLGHHWVRADGPYNEHLVLDVAGLYLGLFVLSIGAARVLTRALVGLTGAAWAVFSVVHLAYHASHLDNLSNLDSTLEVSSLAATLLLALALLAPARA
jgi:hypothetical protein